MDGFHADEIRDACDAILGSSDFQKAHRMRRLLRFLVDQALAGDAGNVSEYVIGIEVFDRRPTDYAAEDPIVRVQVGRLRQRLARYYADRRGHGGIEVHIPVGQHRLAFRRASSPGEPPVAPAPGGGALVIEPIRHIAGYGEGQAFAHGLYEELLNQLFSSFDDVFMRMSTSLAANGSERRDGDARRTAPRHRVEGSVRVDAERIRTSIRLVDASLSRVTWAGQFDRSVRFGIREQEELAASICNALKAVVPA
ncbi:hypothetical protein [Marilutibacter penaei]|uniref:hypothetical protein n=1 Tax=Marilutibacter penaei TaxID=2759900 RepID=UPI001C720C77|nr:hypothetical protein [Lysobacter penaei]